MICIFLLQNNRCITEVFNTDFCVVTAGEELDHQEVISLMNETVCKGAVTRKSKTEKGKNVWFPLLILVIIPYK